MHNPNEPWPTQVTHLGGLTYLVENFVVVLAPVLFTEGKCSCNGGYDCLHQRAASVAALDADLLEFPTPEPEPMDDDAYEIGSYQ
jgi:hypothetical protein